MRYSSAKLAAISFTVGSSVAAHSVLADIQAEPATLQPFILAQADGNGVGAPGGSVNEAAPDQPSLAVANDAGSDFEHTDQSDMATPAAFQFPGHMASVWTRQDVEGLVQDTPVTLPLMIHPPEPFEEGIYVWDAWPVRNPDGSVAVIDDWVVMVGLSAELDEIDETGLEFFTLSTWRYWYTRDGEWRPGGIVFPRDEALGSRQWAGSTFYDPDAQTVTFYYTATGSLDAESIEADMPERRVSIHNEAAGRPVVEQRLALVTASVAASDDGISFADFGEHEMIAEADGIWYDTIDTYLAGEAVYGFRDPEYMVDPYTGREHVLFTANAAGVRGPYNGVVGMATRTDDGDWQLEPPLIVSMGVNSQLERPHVVYRDDGAYLFFSTHDFTFSPEVYGPRGLYGFKSATGSLRGRWTPLNQHGLVAANPAESPAQVYSFLVLPDGLVMSYLNETYGFELNPDNEPRTYVGAPAPMFRIRMEGEIATVAEAENDR